MEASPSFSKPESQDDEREADHSSTDPGVVDRLGVSVRSLTEVSDSGDGGGSRDPDDYTNNPNYQDSFVA